MAPVTSRSSALGEKRQAPGHPQPGTRSTGLRPLTLRLTKERVQPQPPAGDKSCGLSGGRGLCTPCQSSAQINHRAGSADWALGSMWHLLAQVPENPTVGCRVREKSIPPPGVVTVAPERGPSERLQKPPTTPPPTIPPPQNPLGSWPHLAGDIRACGLKAEILNSKRPTTQASGWAPPPTLLVLLGARVTPTFTHHPTLHV